MLDSARQMLITELSTSRGIGQDDAAAVIRRALAKAALELPEPL